MTTRTYNSPQSLKYKSRKNKKIDRTGQVKEIRGNPLESDVGMLPSWSSRINTSKALIMGGKVVPFAGHRTMFVADLLSHIGHNVTTLQYVRLFGTSTTRLFSINLKSYLSGSTWQCRLAVALVKLQSNGVWWIPGFYGCGDHTLGRVILCIWIKIILRRRHIRISGYFPLFPHSSELLVCPNSVESVSCKEFCK